MSLFNLPPLNKAALRRLETLPHSDPTLDEARWQEIQPCRRYQFGSKSVFITQPSSSFWVYLLGILTTLIGGYFLVIAEGQMSRHLWGWSLILWGLGAIIAGTSYQAFGFQLKCQGRPNAIWTSWWEVIYLIFQQVSMNVMLVAVAYSNTSGWLLDLLTLIAIGLSIFYTLLVLYGAIMPIKWLITFEFMVQVSTPIVIFFIALNTWSYWQNPNLMDLSLLGCWAGLIITMLGYWLYYQAGITEKLWKKGIWFSENDVLHVLLILWVLYIPFFMAHHIYDL